MTVLIRGPDLYLHYMFEKYMPYYDQLLLDILSQKELHNGTRPAQSR